MNVSFHSLKLPVLPLNSGKELVFFELASIVSYTLSSVCLSCERRLAGSTGKLITFGSVAFGTGDTGDLCFDLRGSGGSLRAGSRIRGI